MKTSGVLEGVFEKTTNFDKKSMRKNDASGALNEAKALYCCSKPEFSHFEKTKKKKMNAKGMPKGFINDSKIEVWPRMGLICGVLKCSAEVRFLMNF